MATPNNPTRNKQADDFIRIQDLFYLCLNKWYWFVISLVITVGVAVVYLLTTPPVYTRSASLLIKEDSKGNSISDATGVLGDIDLFQTSTNVNNEMQSLQSPAVMLDVVKRLHLDISYYTEGGFYKKVLYGRTCPYQVSFDDLQDNEGIAFTILPDQNGQVRLSDFSRDGEDLEGEVTATLNDPADTPVGKLTIKSTNDSTVYDAPVYVSRIGYQAATGAYASNLSVALSDDKSTVINLSFKDVCIQRAEDVLNTVIAVYNENWIKDKNQLLPANSGIESPGIEQQIANYNTAQLRRNDLVANSSEKNPLVVDMDQSLENMRHAIITSIDNHITTLNTQIRSLQQSEQQTTARIAANPTQGKYLLSVERQQKVKEALYLFLLQKREENELSQAFTAYNTRVITPPSGSMIPTAPVKKNIALVAFALGILIPVVIIFIRENMNTKVRGRKDLESLTVPFVGEIPLAENSKKKDPHVSKKIVIRQGNRDIVNEAFRVLRTNLEFMLDAKTDGKASVTLFTSFNPGSGKTFLTMNTAATFALKGKRVLVIDGDLRHGSASAYIGTQVKGLSDYLGKRENDVNSLILENPDCPGFFLLPAGTTPPNPTELLAEPLFKETIERLRDCYDYIFIDCPPIDIVADTQIIEKLSDRTLFVVRAGLLEREMLPELQRMYDEKRFKNMALLLNGTEGGGKRYGYRYGYKYGYKYGYGSKNYYSN